ncbi:hypothetical protein [Salinibaculum marinum]
MRGFQKALSFDGLPAVVDIAIGFGELVVQLSEELPGQSRSQENADDESDEMEEIDIDTGGASGV